MNQMGGESSATSLFFSLSSYLQVLRRRTPFLARLCFKQKAWAFLFSPLSLALAPSRIPGAIFSRTTL